MALLELLKKLFHDFFTFNFFEYDTVVIFFQNLNPPTLLFFSFRLNKFFRNWAKIKQN